ncbi:MAG TPA: cytochrome c [Thermoanaerobaculia bacterium]|nr:cytochrome c [Thermoanaerobaculia bacterium]
MRRRLAHLPPALALCALAAMAEMTALVHVAYPRPARGETGAATTPASASGLLKAPPSAHERSNPYEGMPEAVTAGRKLFLRHCAECHGDDGKGSPRGPSFDLDRLRQAPPGDLFWFVSNGDLKAGMPSWSRLPDAQRWQLVAYLKTLAEQVGGAPP